MREILNSHLKDHLHMSKDKTEEFTSYFEILNLERERLVLKEGEIADFIAFVEKGVIRTYEYNETGNDVTKFFFKENQFFTNLDSYMNGVPSKFAIQTITPCTLLMIRKEDTLKLPEWSGIFNTLVQKTLVQKIEAQHVLRNSVAKEKYGNFLSTNNDIINRVPLQYIASYLGITPQSLSRIRRSL